MVSGVSLKGCRAALVLLDERERRRLQPVALPIKGSYNRLGTIDCVEEDTNTELVLAYFLEELRAGTFIVDAEYLDAIDCYPVNNIEQLLTAFERTVNDGRAAQFDGRTIGFALVCEVVWDAIANSERAESPTVCFEQVFDDVPMAKQIYSKLCEDLSKPTQELFTVNRFLAERNIPWRVTEGGGQDYPEEMREYLEEARNRFEDSEVLLQALRQYESSVSHLLGDD